MLSTESDVEQKFVYPLLTEGRPKGLGFEGSQVKTKSSIKKLTIDKGGAKKLYFPDYAIVIDGVPSVIIEVKAPGEDLSDALREARLYAAEINALYSTGLNPCARVVATDGSKILAGFWDQTKPEIELMASSVSSIDADFEKLVALVGIQAVSTAAQEVLKLASKGATFVKPISLIGGKSVAEETVGENSFGANISVEYKHLFNPESMAERESVVQNAYVTSKRRMSHVGSIDKIIRASVPPHVRDARAISDLEKPLEVTNQLRRVISIRNEMCLLIGSVGSGKSTFTDFLRVQGLPADLASATAWLSLNLNVAPVSKDKIYDWVLDQVISCTKEKFPTVDFEELAFLKKLYAYQLAKIEKGRAALFSPDSEQFRNAIFDELRRLESDRLETAKAYIAHFFADRGKQLVVVLDNCDKRGRDDQLLMFDVASWLKSNLSCTIFLPLRDTTYDQYRTQPPLDTVIKDLVFRIDPPLLEQVIHARLKYALRDIASNDRSFSYVVSNGMRVECKREEVGGYLKSIVSSLFQDGFFRRVITGLAGRNVRRGLEIVLDFCKSGYINESEILKIRSSLGEHKIPNHLVSKILLKGQRRYYSDAASSVKNLFSSSHDDSQPNPFVRIAILQWLRVRRSEYGPNRTKGFHQVSALVEDLQVLGFSSFRICSEVQSLVEADCIDSESRGAIVESSDLITIAPAGYVHLDLIQDVNYLSTVAEDVLFDSKEAAKAVADNMVGRGLFPVDSRQAALSSATKLLSFLERSRNAYLLGDAKVVADLKENYSEILSAAVDKVGRLIDNDLGYKSYEGLLSQYPPGSDEVGQVSSVQHYGFFVDFGSRGHGLVHKSRFNGLGGDIEPGDWVVVRIIKYERDRRRFDLELREVD